MAQKTGISAALDRLGFLFRETHQTSFYQAIMLLERLFRHAPALGHEGPAREEPIRLRPSLSLSAPASDLEGIAPHGEDRINITTTFLGLYGTDSPLPYTYIERLAQEASEPDGQRVKDFLDIFHHRILSLLYRSWKKARPLSSKERHDPLFGRVLSVIGFASDAAGEGKEMPHLAEVRMRVLQARTTATLEALLQHRLGYGCPVRQLQQRKVAIPLEQRTMLGLKNNLLGATLVIGKNIHDRNKICISVEAADYAMFEELMPDRAKRAQLDDVLESYLRDPIDYEVEVTLATEQVPPWELGEKMAIGFNTWLGLPRPLAVCRWPRKQAAPPEASSRPSSDAASDAASNAASNAPSSPEVN